MPDLPPPSAVLQWVASMRALREAGTGSPDVQWGEAEEASLRRRKGFDADIAKCVVAAVNALPALLDGVEAVARVEQAWRDNPVHSSARYVAANSYLAVVAPLADLIRGEGE